VLTDVMQQVITSGTGTRARLAGWQPAGKTGTAQEHADAWFVGSVPLLSTAVWVGHPQAQVPMPGMTGGSVPAMLWRQFMEAALEGVEPVAFLVTDTDVDTLVRGEAVAVPDVRRMDRQEAIQELLEDRLVAAIRSVPSTAPAGVVVWQSPGPGTEVTVGGQVTVGVSTGQPPPPEPAEEPAEEESEDADQPPEGDEPPSEDDEPPPDENPAPIDPGDG
jgi:membrane peptidoglycan carboxypeptidase